MNVLLVRHGETAWNRDGRYQGRTDIPLSDLGVQQVRALARRLEDVPIAFAVSSPLSRAQATAEAVTAPRSIALELDAGLVEISHGEWEGKLVTDIERSHVEMFGTWKSAPAHDTPAGPNAETLGDVDARAWPVLVRATARLHGDQTVLIAAHDAVNRVLLCRVLGLPLARVWSFRQASATLNVLSGPSLDALQVVRLNDCEHVAPLLGGAPHRAL